MSSLFVYRYSSLIQQSHTAITYEELTTFMKYKQLYGIFEQKKNSCMVYDT